MLVLWVSWACVAGMEARNKPEREQWFMDLGFGMFVHWGVDVQIGSVISHSMAGASADYLDRFVKELPKTFNPTRFDPAEWAVLAKLAGMKYVVFTAKHHSGFCMWDTETTDFNVMHTPCGKDLTKEIVEAFRAQGIAVGLYFSPEDFHYLYRHGIPVGRLQHPLHFPKNNKGLMELDKAQLKELLTRYGKIDILFFDGPAEGLKEYAWEIDPDIVVTRGEMETPEQTILKDPKPGPWEACFTMGTDWQYKPTNDPHKSGTQIVNMLIETRAKGGNLLMNVGPKPNGEIQIEQETRLRELALWNMVNGEAVHDTRPWHLMKEGGVWFTMSKDSTAVYAFVPGGDEWPYATRKEFLFRTLAGTEQTEVSVLGYGSELVEYKTGFDAEVRVESTSLGLLVSAVNGQRLYTNNRWPNPVVLKFTNVAYRPLEDAKVTQVEMDGAK